jgi:hypothetical protein
MAQTSELPTESNRNPTEPPLWSIGVAVIVILGAPLVLYSLAPAGPIREGDTVFSAGQQLVALHHTDTVTDRKGKDDSCLLDPNSPLIVRQTQEDQAAGSLLAEVQGTPTIEWPFCPVHAKVLVKSHQIFQKPAVFASVHDALERLFNR